MGFFEKFFSGKEGEQASGPEPRPNQVTEISGLNQLKGLKSLDLKHNQITKIDGLDKLTELQELPIVDDKMSEKKIADVRANIDRIGKK